MDKINGFINFKNWALKNGYQDHLTIDRIDNNGNYEPDNCRWVTIEENTQNRRTSKLNVGKVKEIREFYKLGIYTQKELSIKYSVKQCTISQIINNNGWKNI